MPRLLHRNASLEEACRDEPALVAAAKRDRQAFAPLYERYLDPVYRYCFRCLGSKEAAEDATSQVFSRALAGLPTCRNDEAFRSWLFAIAHNTIVDLARSRGREHPLAAALAIPDPAPSPEELGVAAEERRALQALFRFLTPEQRRVMELRLSGLTGPETARVLGLSHGAVKLAQFRALQRIRPLLGIEATSVKTQAPEEAGHGDR
jgi:RNA polymerase sigma-70 factor (ECF subfamily)